ncbi:MAG TPA: hypothetical protein VGM08_00940 [Candidatus Saccharimonadales bacterium]
MPRLTTETIRRYVQALPATHEAVALDERAAQAARSVLGQTDPTWEDRLRVRIDAIIREITPNLDYDSQSGRYAITGAELRGIVARAVSQASGQVAVDVGQALEQTSLAAQLTLVQTEDSEADEGASAESYERPDLQQEF